MESISFGLYLLILGRKNVGARPAREGGSPSRPGTKEVLILNLMDEILENMIDGNMIFFDEAELDLDCECGGYGCGFCFEDGVL